MNIERNDKLTLKWIFHQAAALLIAALITDGWKTLSILLILFVPLNIALYVFGKKIPKLSVLMPYVLIFVAVMLSDVIAW